MPKIPQYLIDKADAGEIDTKPRGKFLIPEGYYAMVLTEQEPDEKPAGPGINATFRITRGSKKGHELKYNWLSFSEGGVWKPLQLLAAAGYTNDTDFQELIDGEDEFIAYVAIEVQTAGKNKGKDVNNISEFIPLVDEKGHSNEGLLDD